MFFRDTLSLALLEADLHLADLIISSNVRALFTENNTAAYVEVLTGNGILKSRGAITKGETIQVSHMACLLSGLVTQIVSTEQRNHRYYDFDDITEGFLRKYIFNIWQQKYAINRLLNPSDFEVIFKEISPPVLSLPEVEDTTKLVIIRLFRAFARYMGRESQELIPLQI